MKKYIIAFGAEHCVAHRVTAKPVEDWTADEIAEAKKALAELGYNKEIQ